MHRLQKSADTAFRELDGEAVIITLKDRRIHVLNETATVIYRRICEGGSAQDACAALCSDYDITPECARADVASTLDELVGLGILVEGSDQESTP